MQPVKQNVKAFLAKLLFIIPLIVNNRCVRRYRIKRFLIQNVIADGLYKMVYSGNIGI